MKKIRLGLVGFVLFLAGCIPSLHPLYTEETMVFREELIGAWKEKPQDEDSWTFVKGEKSSYRLTIQEKEKSSVLEARLVKLGDQLFLDLTPDGDALKNAKLGEFYCAALIPGHLILKVKLGGKLELQFLEPEKLQEFLKANPDALAHTEVEDRLIITATTPALQAFFKKHADTKELWGEAAVMWKLIL
jgi:hypothetical protein